MKKTIYRCFVDIKAKDKNDAVIQIANEIDSRGSDLNGLFRIQENPFTDEEEGTILETARVALSDAETYEYIADKLDLSDKELKTLQEKIERITN